MTAHDRPTAAELTVAVRDFLEAEILPGVDDQRLRFRTLVAMNALSIAVREGTSAREPSSADLERAHRLRAGDIREGDLETIRAEIREKLLVASPRYLERYE